MNMGGREGGEEWEGGGREGEWRRGDFNKHDWCSLLWVPALHHCMQLQVLQCFLEECLKEDPDL